MIIQSIEVLEKELKEGKVHAVYLVLGPEEYLCRQAAVCLKNNLTTPDAMAFDYSEFIAGDASVDEIMEAANTFPMASKRRLVFVNDADKLRDVEQDLLLEGMAKLPSRSTLVLFALEMDRRKKFYRTLRETACVAEFPSLNAGALERWAETQVKKRGYKIASSALKKIADLAGSDLQNLAMELDKLLLFAGDSKVIPDSAVDDLVRGSREQSIWDLVDSVGRRDRSSALKSLANLIGMGEPPLRIVAMLARHFRQVLIVQESIREGVPGREIESRAQIPHFKLQDFIRDARAFNPGAVRKMFLRIGEIDRQLKTSGADGRLLLENLICSL